MCAAFGVATGVCWWGLASVLGIAAVLASSAAAFTVVKVLGAVYLGYLGVRTLLATRDVPPATTGRGSSPNAQGAVPLLRSFRQGLLTNALNPKAAVMFLTIIPQFLSTSDSVSGIVVYAGILAAVALTWFCVYSTLISTLRPLFERRRTQQTLDVVTGVTLTGLGVRLALETH